MAVAAERREQELLDIEQRFWNAMKAKDAQTASELTDERCIVVGAQGVSAIDPATMAKLTTEGEWVLEQFRFDEKTRQVRFLNDDVAIVAYQVHERVTLEGKTLPIEANDASVWVRRGSKWLCALHTESLAGDPYGRDKQSK